MFKKLVFCAVLVVFCSSMAVADSSPNWYLRGQGGVTSTWDQLKESKVAGTASFSFMRKVWGQKIFVGGGYQDINNAVGFGNFDTYTGKIYVFTRDPGISLLKYTPQMYLVLAGGVAHEVNSGLLGNGAFNGGFGILIPSPLADFLIETTAFNTAGTWSFDIGAGIQIGMDF